MAESGALAGYIHTAVAEYGDGIGNFAVERATLPRAAVDLRRLFVVPRARYNAWALDRLTSCLQRCPDVAALKGGPNLILSCTKPHQKGSRARDASSSSRRLSSSIPGYQNSPVSGKAQFSQARKDPSLSVMFLRDQMLEIQLLAGKTFLFLNTTHATSHIPWHTRRLNSLIRLPSIKALW